MTAQAHAAAAYRYRWTDTDREWSLSDSAEAMLKAKEREPSTFLFEPLYTHGSSEILALLAEAAEEIQPFNSMADLYDRIEAALGRATGGEI